MLYLIRMLSRLRRVAKAIALACAVCLLLVFAERSTLFEDSDRLTFDFAVDHFGLSAPSKEIVLVDFDEDTFQHLQQFPLPRMLFVKAIRLIAAGKPKVIGLDVLLTEPRNPADDQAMQEALTSAGIVILASQSQDASLSKALPLNAFCQPEEPRSGFCKEGTPGAMGYGFINMPIDADGFVRQANLFTNDGVSFPLMLAQQYAGQSMEPGGPASARFLGHTIPYDDRETRDFAIGSWGREPATRISAWQLLTGKVPSSTFAGKLVLIGQSSTASSDVHYTPLFRVADRDGLRLQMGGTAIHAAAIRTLLEGTAVRPAPRLLTNAWIFGACVLGAMLLLHCDLIVGISGLLALMAVLAAVSMGLFAKLRFWLPFLPAEVALAFTLPVTLGARFVEERLVSRQAGLQRAQLMKLFASYVDPKVAETIWERRAELSLGGVEHIATVMFTDIRGFTALSNNQPPAVVLCWLNRYLEAMDEVIRVHGGFLNKFIGDGLMILFGVPLDRGPKEEACAALDCALAMIERVEQLNREHADDLRYPQLRIGVGIHTGRLVAGSIGSASRQEYSVIGETVNLASRLESLNKTFKTEILMSAATVCFVVERFPQLESLGPAKVAGLEEPVEVFTLRTRVEAHLQIHSQVLSGAGAGR